MILKTTCTRVSLVWVIWLVRLHTRVNLRFVDRHSSVPILLVDQAFLGVVSTSVDQLEESISQAERELDPSKLRKVFSALPKLVGPLIIMRTLSVIFGPSER